MFLSTAHAVADRNAAPLLLRRETVIGVPVFTGMFALRTSHNRRFGVVLIVAGYPSSLTALGESSASIPYSVGRVVAWTIPPILIYLMLTFPDGRLRTPIERGLFGVCIGIVTSLYLGSALFIDAYPAQTPWASCVENCPENAFQLVVPEPGAMEAIVQPVREGLTAVLLLGVIVRLIHVTGTASPVPPSRDAAGGRNEHRVRRDARRLPGGAPLGRGRALSRDLNGKVDLSDTRRTLARVLGDDSVEVLVPDVAVRGWRDTGERSRRSRRSKRAAGA